MKVISITFVIFCFGGFIIGCSNSIGRQNFEDLSRIEVGMKISEVHNLMRNAPIDSKVASWSDSLLVERYKSSVGSSDHYEVIYTKKDCLVVKVNWGD